jgi:large subunit ribosomal protein L23
MHLEEIIKKPLITEKTSVATDKYNKYVFCVHSKANKNQIKKAIEELYDVRVLSVNTNITPGKLKRVGSSIKKTSNVKKALVKLAEGQKIEFFKGV